MKQLKNYNLLFIEDNQVFAKNTKDILDLYFKKVYLTPSIKGAKEIFSKENIHIIFSDIKVEDGIGLDFISDVRLYGSQIPIVVISAHLDRDFLFHSIPLKLVDYIVKPIEYKSLMNTLKRCEDLLTKQFNEIEIYHNTFYRKNRKDILKEKTIIPLTGKESLLIELLISKEDIVSKEEIQDSVWQDEIMSDSALKNLLLRLRKKVGKEFIKTVTNIGYKLQN